MTVSETIVKYGFYFFKLLKCNWKDGKKLFLNSQRKEMHLLERNIFSERRLSDGSIKYILTISSWFIIYITLSEMVFTISDTTFQKIKHEISTDLPRNNHGYRSWTVWFVLVWICNINNDMGWDKAQTHYKTNEIHFRT